MDLIAGNQTEFQTRTVAECFINTYGKQVCCVEFFRKLTPKNKILQQLVGHVRCFKFESDYDNNYASGDFQSSTTSYSQMSAKAKKDDFLKDIVWTYLLPIVLVLIAICFVLGVVLIVKSYMMAPLKQNLAVAIRRRRRQGHAPDNNYVPPEEMRASVRLSGVSDRKSLPPPEVLMAARERASQMFHV